MNVKKILVVDNNEAITDYNGLFGLMECCRVGFDDYVREVFKRQ